MGVAATSWIFEPHGLGVAAERTDTPDLINTLFDRITAELVRWGPCTPTDACDRCADPDNDRLCRFPSVRYALIAAHLTRDNALDEERAEAFSPAGT